MSGRAPWIVLAAVVLFVALAMAWGAPASLSPRDAILDVGDPLHLAYVMAWDAHQIARRPWALFDSNSFHPYRRSLAFGDHLLPEALLVAPVFWLSGNAVLASNLAVLLALVLSALAMSMLVREATGSWAAAVLAGLYYAFNSFTRQELLRVHVISVEWWPLALLVLGRLVRGRRPRHAWLLGLFLLLQGLSGSYYLVYTALMAPVWVLVAYVGARRRPSRGEITHLALAGVAAVLLALGVLWPYLDALRRPGVEKDLAHGLDALCYVSAPAASAVWGGTSSPRYCPPHPPFVGYFALALAALGAVRVLLRRAGPGQAPGWLALATIALGGLLSLGPVLQVGGRDLGTGPYGVLHRLLPLLRGMDGSVRASVLVFLGVAVLVGLGAALLLQPLTPVIRGAVVAGLVLLLPLEHWTVPRAGFSVPSGAAVPSVYRWLSREDGPLVELPLYPEPARRFWSLYLYFSTYHWRPVPIGRTSFYPPAHDLLAWRLGEFPSEASLLALERLGVRTILVHPWLWPEPERTARLAELEATPRLKLEATFAGRPDERFARLRLGDERAYRLLPGAASATPPCTPDDELPRQTLRLDYRRGTVRAPRSVWLERRLMRVNWRPEWAADGNRETTFSTDRPQQPGDRLEALLARPDVVAAARLELGARFAEFPRGLGVIAEDPDGRRDWVSYEDGPDERWADLASFLERPAEAALTLRFPPRAVRRLVFMVRGAPRPEAPPWSVAELRLFRRCR